ncbi:endo alpha-1,4 polygalactosaminidase [Frankia sp. AgB1.9]|uniref:endo alpha-1,4 polygalactosaminidase n=1 Tax=unclassified Frankia TaxID=2632575 RepID=UPI0019333166|nr:endo alpha-1,4 polygalactosaminidase [Frankia sp. AgW1.1]MBL7547210.1 endo alpha-1,4 polygalactosaminidase [Frankia sp. AgB1.9]MBL7623998.1 endo alpha-1,4 polygalactosaminidase [Frankia sp. AgB1.8]
MCLCVSAGGCSAGDPRPDREATAGVHVSSAAASSAGPPPAVPAPSPGPVGDQRARVVLPPVGAPFDYQLGGPYTPLGGVRVVSRDRTAAPVAGLYNICYVNAFQAQPDALEWWQAHHPELLLRRGDHGLVADRDWGEALLDTSTAARRAALLAVVAVWVDGCAASGFQAVEPDNLDSFERAEGLLTEADNAAFAELVARRAHADGLAVGQKNTAELLGQRTAVGFDFAVTEECGTYGECADFAAAYDDRVYDVEYSDRGLAKACVGWMKTISIVRRDRDVVPAGSDGYTYRTC